MFSQALLANRPTQTELSSVQEQIVRDLCHHCANVSAETHTRLTALFIWVSWYQRGKTNMDFTEAKKR